MVLQELIIKKSESTLTSVVMTTIIVIGLFTGMFIWLQSNASQSGVNIDPKYNDTYNKLNEARDDIDNNIQDIKENMNQISEADSTWQVAWNGLKGLGNTLKLPITFVSSTEKTFEAIAINTDIVPGWVKTLALMGIVILIVLIILAILIYYCKKQ